ncbi:MAG: DNA-processing protein DprA [Candidatus Methanoperedens sp.]|nr:DNA-processing protein DprA [Candidatus Methanoperedens sp.]
MKTISILALQQIPGIGTKTIEKILSLSGISEPTCPVDLIEILKKANAEFGRISIPEIEAANKGWDKAHEILDRSQKQDIQIISKESPYYPKYLSIISNPPVLLHVKGNIDALNKDSVAIVGTRKPSESGKVRARRIAELFTKEGYIIVSGLAQGVDTAAHMGALETDGLTVAVLAQGLDTVYPYENKELANTIIKKKGALVSEYPIGTETLPRYFIERDRIQSGLSLGTIVIETGIKGGTMHTVGFCEKQKRILIVMKPTLNQLDSSKQSGNTQLITENRVNIVFGEEDDVDLVNNILYKKKEELSMLISTHQISPLIIDLLKPPVIETLESTLTPASPNQSNSFVTIDECEQPTIKTIKEEPFKFVSANKFKLSLSSTGYAKQDKSKIRRKSKIIYNVRKFEEF